VSKGLFRIGFKNFVDAAVGPIVLLKSELARWWLGEVGWRPSDDGGKRHQNN